MTRSTFRVFTSLGATCSPSVSCRNIRHQGQTRWRLESSAAVHNAAWYTHCIRIAGRNHLRASWHWHQDSITQRLRCRFIGGWLGITIIHDCEEEGVGRLHNDTPRLCKHCNHDVGVAIILAKLQDIFHTSDRDYHVSMANFVTRTLVAILASQA